MGTLATVWSATCGKLVQISLDSDMDKSKIADALGAETVGNVSGTHWECYECDASGSASSGYAALAAMHQHRQDAHGA